MIIYNGHFRYEISNGGGEDEYGRPIQSTSEWSAAIPCRIQANSDTRKGVYQDGKFRQASFSVLIEPMDVDFTRVSLTWMDKEQGEYDVLSYKWLEAVGAMELIVAN